MISSTLTYLFKNVHSFLYARVLSDFPPLHLKKLVSDKHISKLAQKRLGLISVWESFYLLFSIAFKQTYYYQYSINKFVQELFRYTSVSESFHLIFSIALKKNYKWSVPNQHIYSTTIKTYFSTREISIDFLHWNGINLLLISTSGNLLKNDLGFPICERFHLIFWTAFKQTYVISTIFKQPYEWWVWQQQICLRTT